MYVLLGYPLSFFFKWCKYLDTQFTVKYAIKFEDCSLNQIKNENLVLWPNSRSSSLISLIDCIRFCLVKSSFEFPKFLNVDSEYFNENKFIN